MEHYFQSSAARKNELKYHKKRLTQDQVSLLESSFNFNKKLDPDGKSQLAQELGLPQRKVAIWYQNKRARWKNESLEVDCKALQLRLENVLADNERLQIEVDGLRSELQKAEEMLISVSNNNYNNNNNNSGGFNPSFSSQISSSCDEVGSSNLIVQDHGSAKNHLDKDFFACLIGGQGQFGTTNNDHGFFPPPLS